MSRLGTGFGFNKYNASLWGGGTETYSANVANFDGTDAINLGLLTSPALGDCSFMGSFSETGQVANQVIFANYNVDPIDDNVICFINASGKIEIAVYKDSGNGYGYATTDSFDDGLPHKFIIHLNRASNKPEIYVDTNVIRTLTGAIIGAGLSGDIQFAQEFYIGTQFFAGGGAWFDGGIPSFSYQLNHTTSDQRDYIFGLGEVIPCWDLYSAEGYASQGYYIFGNWTGNTGNELKDWSGTNSDAIDVTGVLYTGSAQIECEA